MPYLENLALSRLSPVFRHKLLEAARGSVHKLRRTGTDILTLYYAAGGDWGSAISKALGIFHENSCLAIHVTLVVAAPSWLNPWHLLQLANLTLPFADKLPLFVSAGEVALLKNGYKFMKEGSGEPQLTVNAWTCASM